MIETRLLLRQIAKVGASVERPPDERGWQDFLERIERSYKEAEADRYLLERSLDKVSAEMQQLYESLRRASEQSLAIERDKLKAIISATGDGLATVDAEGIIQSINPAGARMLGWNAEELAGKSLREIVSSRDVEIDPTFCEALAEGRVYRSDRARFAHHDMGFVHVSYVLTPISQDKQNTGFVLVFHDMTTRKRVEEQLEHARAEAEATSRIKSEFLANMSHEIRTPMNAVLGMAGLLLDTPLNEEQRDYAAIVKSSGEHLMSLLNSILDLSKIEAGRLELERVEFDIRRVVDEVLQIFSERGAGPEVELVGHVGATVPPRVVGDPNRLRQVLLNFVSNAMKFTERGEVTVSVHLIAVVDGRAEVHFSVRDTGIGMAEEAMSRLFTPFTQADGSTTRRFGGTGLGLAISKQLVELMRGRVGVDSKKGQGSEFWFTAQFAVCQSDQDELPLEVKGLRALLVDDNAASRTSISETLGEWGVEVVAVESSMKAFVALSQAKSDQAFDMVLLDQHLPGLSGLEIARALCADHSFDHITKIWMGNLSRGIHSDDLRQVGIRVIIPKPVRRQSMRQALMRGFAPEMGRELLPTMQPPPREFFAPVRTRTHGAQILVAEDNLVNQRLAGKLLERIGYTYDVVANGLEAVEAVAANAYRLVLMDCMMPEMDGYQATRELRHKGFKLPIVAMTANALPGARETCIGSGMDDYITKPIEPQRLETVLKRWFLPVLDTDGLSDIRSLVGDQEENLEEIFRVFIADARKSLVEISNAIQDGDIKALSRLAHKLKSASGYLGARALQQRCVDIEQAAADADTFWVLHLASQVAPALEAFRQAATSRGLLGTEPL